MNKLQLVFGVTIDFKIFGPGNLCFIPAVIMFIVMFSCLAFLAS